MHFKKFGKLDQKIHPAGSLGAQLKTVEDLMKQQNSFVNENLNMKQALKVLSHKTWCSYYKK